MYHSLSDYLWTLRCYLTDRYGITTAMMDLAPLSWYINTGRASREFASALINAKPFMVARRLHKGGSYDEALERVMECIGYERIP